MPLQTLWTSVEPTALLVGALLLALLIGYAMLRYCRVYVYISSQEYGVVERLFSRKGSLRAGLISLDGRAGFQPDILRTGPHFMVPFVYRVHKQPLITVRTMAYVYARDGIPLPAGQTLAHTPPEISFEDARKFLTTGGQRGPQRGILREGVYAIHTAQFVVFTDNQIYAIDLGNDRDTLQRLARQLTERNAFSPIVLSGSTDQIGVVTVMDGPALDPDDIIAPRVGDAETFHNSYQDIEAFLNAGGRRGRQEQVITEGTYYINRWFAEVEFCPKTVIDVGTVGVVVSYIGSKGRDVSGDTYHHGELVEDGHRGVLAAALPPGKYAINPYARRIEPMPTTNFVLRWIEGRVEDHGYDRGLSEIPLITKDAFQPRLPLSVVVHIAPIRAPRVIQRFAGVKLLVDQTIDPMISAFFKDVAQRYTLIDLINKRDELQKQALVTMKQRFQEYDLDLLEVMIGSPRATEEDVSIPNILEQLRQRQVAFEQIETYKSQQQAAEAQKALNEARATAEQQLSLTASTIAVKVAENEGSAEFQRQAGIAKGQQAIGEANAAVIKATGLAQAEATDAQVKAFTGEGAEHQLRRIVVESLAGAIVGAKFPIVPNVAVHGGVNGAAGGPIEALLAMVTAETAQRHTGRGNGADHAPLNHASSVD